MGKAEGRGEDWHGHVTAVTVAPEYRRLGLADYFMTFLEEVSEKKYVHAHVVVVPMSYILLSLVRLCAGTTGTLLICLCACPTR